MAQRVKHSKIKNTGILFELLSRQITVDVMNDDGKSKAVEMLKKSFNEKTELGKENQLYQVLLKENYNSSRKAEKLVDAVLKAISKFAEVPAASGGTMTNVAFAGEGWAFYETVATGSGALPFADGADGVHVYMTNTLNTPIEIIEREYPIRIVEYSLREGKRALPCRSFCTLRAITTSAPFRASSIR